MDVERKLCFAGNLLTNLDHVHSPTGLATNLSMGLDTANHIQVFKSNLDRVFFVDATWTIKVWIEVPFQSSDEITGDEAQRPRR